MGAAEEMDGNDQRQYGWAEKVDAGLPEEARGDAGANGRIEGCLTIVMGSVQKEHYVAAGIIAQLRSRTTTSSEGRHT